MPEPRTLCCILCDREKPATSDFFIPRADRPGQFYPYCRTCWAVKRNANTRKRALEAGRYCACGCGELLLDPRTRFRAGHYTPCGTLGKVWSAPPTVAPSPLDIVWAAGIYEGEGTCTLEGSVSVPQKEIWLVQRLREFFGGKVGHDGTVWKWYVSGERGRAFLDAIYSYLSPRRQARIDQYRARVERLRQQFPPSEWTPHRKRQRVWPGQPRHRSRANPTNLSD